MSNMKDKAEANRKQRINNERYRREIKMRAEGKDICRRCGEVRANPLKPCGFCKWEDEGSYLSTAA